MDLGQPVVYVDKRGKIHVAVIVKVGRSGRLNLAYVRALRPGAKAGWIKKTFGTKRGEVGDRDAWLPQPGDKVE